MATEMAADGGREASLQAARKQPKKQRVNG